ncbi:MAG TPA: sugar phosphate isomerase/epimerase family protein [Bacteroidales bacterium]|nr:sugar phosphate isomerase/epimerase family protein [Bacteroidales bacterium]
MVSKPLSRRHFIGKAMLATTGINLISSLKTSFWQTGCFTRPWAQFDYVEAFDGIAEAGFSYAGLMSSKSGPIITKDTNPEQAAKIYEEARSRGLKIACIHGGNFDVSNSVTKGIEGLKSLIDSSAICGCPNLLLLGINKPEFVEDYYKVVGECCDYAAGKGVIISIKPHGPLNNTGMECRPLIEKIRHKNFRLWYDPGNIYYYSDGKINPVDDAVEVDGLVTGMSIKDFRMPKDVEITPGTGMVNFQKVMKRLRKGGFKQGALLVECLSKGDLKFINYEARKAYGFLEELLR